MDFYDVGKCMCYIYAVQFQAGPFRLYVVSSQKNMIALILSV